MSCISIDIRSAGIPARSLLLLAAGLASATPCLAQHDVPELAQGPATFDASVTPEIQVKRAPTGHLLVRPVVNGIDAGWFIFDTGAGICVVSTPHVEEFALTAAGAIDALGAGGSESAALHRAKSLVLGPLTLTDHPVMATDLSFLKQHLGEEIVGVIGYGLLTECIAEIDLAAPRIALHDRKTWTLASGTWTPMSLADRVPAVDATFEGHAGRFQIDTGANSSITFNEPSVRKWALLEDRDLTDAKLGGVGGFVAAKKGTLATFELCGLRRENVPADFAIEAKGAFASSSHDGNIGARFLEQFLIVADYAGERIALTPHAAK